MLELYPYQRTGVDFLTNRYHALLADDMGLGKTIQVIHAANRLKPKSMLIICPASVKYNWARELAEHLDRHLNIQVVKNGATIISKESHIVIINYDLITKPAIYKQLKDRVFSIGVCDEAHKLKNPSAKRTRWVLGRKDAIMARCLYKWMLTGTPILNRPEELYVLLKTLAPEILGEFSSWPKYALHFCDGHWQDGEFSTKGASNIDELRVLLHSFMLRRTKEEVLPDLPETIHQIIYLDEVNYPDDEEIPLSTRRRELSERKLPHVLSHVRTLLDFTGKLVIFAHHRDTILLLGQHLGPFGVVVISGGVSSERKQQNIDRFVNDSDCRILIGQISAAGQGVDGLQRVAKTIVFAEMDWSPGVMDQAIDRLRRIGQRDSVLVQYLIAPNTMDSIIEATLSRKRRLIRRIMETEQEKTTMSIEQSLERIATALEALSAGPLQVSPDALTEEKPKAKTTAKKAEKKAEIEPPKPAYPDDIDAETSDSDGLDFDLLGDMGTSPEPVTVTLEDVRDAVMDYCKTQPDDKAAKIQCRDVFKKVASVEKMVEIPIDKFPAIIAGLKALG